MKKTIFLVLLIITLFYACSKNSPTSTPNVEQTVGAVLAETANANATQTQAAKLYSPTISPTITITPTATASPNMTQTIGVILTAVGADNATATEQAQEAATAAAGLYTATLTSTITPSPNQTSTAAAIGTIIANIHQTETAVAEVATQTAVVVATQTAVVVATQTAVAEVATQTAVVVATQTAVVVATQTAVVVNATQTAVAAVATQTAVAAILYTDLASVPGGTFIQTDTSANSFSHTISTFKMGKYQVTYDLWYAVYQWAIANGYIFANAGKEGLNGNVGAAPTAAKYQPVTIVSWRDVIVWCNAYSQEAGLTPCYTYLSAVIKDSTNATACDSAVCVWTNNGYRLPTEGEYQYAASYIDGSNWTPYNYASGATADYTNATATELVAWYGANCSSTQAVGGKTANALGIYDMSGNVWEWCWDWYGAYPGTSTDYRGPASGSDRVIRGGGFHNCYADFMQVGYRSNLPSYGNPYYTYGFYGFRFARTY
jgi:sulfatase modifying factor 1